MGYKRVMLGLAATGAAMAAGAFLGERRVLQKMDATPPPAGWRKPRFPDGNELMVPTDDGAELRVVFAGPEEGPVVVLVHGLTSNSDDWGPVAELLVAGGNRVIGVNQRGHGGSSVGTEGFGPARQGADLGQVLSALDLDGVTVVGHSMGGVAAMSLLTLRPETGAHRIGRLVLVATLADSGGPDRKLTLRLGDTAQYQELARHPRHAPAMARVVFGRMPARVMVDHALESNRACPPETRHGAAMGLLDYDVRDLLPTITVPTVVVCGDRDLLTPLRENRAIADAIAGAELVVVEDVGHLIIWEAPERVVQAIEAVAASAPQASHLQ